MSVTGVVILIAVIGASAATSGCFSGLVTRNGRLMDVCAPIAWWSGLVMVFYTMWSGAAALTAV